MNMIDDAKRWVRERLDIMLEDPDKFGGLEAYEMQICQLMQFALVLDGDRNSDLTFGRAYCDVHKEQLPMVGMGVPMWNAAGWTRDANGFYVPGPTSWQNIVQFFTAVRKKLGL